MGNLRIFMSSGELNERKDEIEKLVKKVQVGDQDAFAKIYDYLVDPLYKYIFYRVNSSQDAEDLLETLFLKVWENIKNYKSQKSSFVAWTFRIAHNLVVDYYRVSKDRFIDELSLNLPDLNRQHNPIKVTQNTLDQEVLKVALSKLKKKYRDIIIYKFINELSNQEISKILDRSEGNLRILQFRALKSLKKQLENMGVNY